MEKIIAHIPHSSLHIPQKYRDLFLLDESSLRKELIYMTDLYTDEIFEIYDAHHAKLEKMCEDILNTHSEVLIVDCHSFHPQPLPYECNQDNNRPDICIGTDAYHTPESLINKLVSAYEAFGYRVAINAPFSGSLTPLRYYQKNPNVHSVMIEINRKLYIDENGQKTENF